MDHNHPRQDKNVEEGCPACEKLFEDERQLAKKLQQPDGCEYFDNIYKMERLPYRRHLRSEFQLTLHWGQRKLLLTEIEFLAIALKKYPNVNDIVYVGSAPGDHTPYLCKLFPKMKFYLYDPRDFNRKLYSLPQVKIYQKFFVDEDAKKYNGCLFVSDIRSTGTEVEFSKSQAAIAEDMTLQMNWLQMCNAKLSMLKFKLPYSAGKTEYLDGEIRIQPWAPVHSTETRLIVDIADGYRKRVYDNDEYNDLMYTFNNIYRQLWYKHNIKQHGIDHCWDCVHEMTMLQMYLRNMGRPHEQSDVEAMIEEINVHLGKSTHRPPHGILVDIKDLQQRIRETIKAMPNILIKIDQKRKNRNGYDLDKYRKN